MSYHVRATRNFFLVSVLVTLILLASSRVEAQAPTFQVIDPGFGTMQVTVDGSVIYVLKSNGQIWERRDGKWKRQITVSGLRMIAAGDDKLYALQSDGSIICREKNHFVVVDRAGETRQIVCDRQGRLYVLKENGNVWQRAEKQFKKVSSGTSTRFITAGDWLYLLQDSDEIFQWMGPDRWSRVDDGRGTRQVAADLGILYVLKDDGKIWRRMNDTWQILNDGMGTDQISARAGNLYAIKRQGELWRYIAESWSRLPDAPLARQIAAQGRNVLVLQQNGNLLQLTSPEAPVPIAAQLQFKATERLISKISAESVGSSGI